MKIDIKHIAKLSKLEIGEEKSEMFTKQMEAIIDMVDSLPAIDGEVLSLDSSNPMRLREDVVVESFPRSEILQNAPQTQAGCVVVPKVME